MQTWEPAQKVPLHPGARPKKRVPVPPPPTPVLDTIVDGGTCFSPGLGGGLGNELPGPRFLPGADFPEAERHSSVAGEGPKTRERSPEMSQRQGGSLLFRPEWVFIRAPPFVGSQIPLFV